MTLISENWPTLLAPGLRKVFHTRMRAREELFKRTQIFPIDTSSRAYEDYQAIGEVSPAIFNEYAKAGRVTRDTMEPGWKTRLEHRRYSGAITIERELMDDNLYPGAGIPKTVTGRVEKLADAAAIHREKSAAALFNNAFTDSGVDSEGFDIAGADGVGLGSTAHKQTPTNTATQTNEGTSALSAASLKSTRLAMREFTDDRGELISVHPDTLLVPPELEDTAIILTRTDRDPESAENAINVNAGRFNVISWDYLTDATAWFMIDSFLKSQHLVWLDRVLPEFSNQKDWDTEQCDFKAYYRFSRGYDAWQWVYAQNG